MRTWFKIIYLMLTSKKGIAALQVQRMFGFGSYSTAHYMCHRIRAGLADHAFRKLIGIVEVDETFVGPGPDIFVNGRGWQKQRGPAGKRIVVTLVERGGSSRSIKVDKLNAETIGEILRDNVSRQSRVHTDEAHHYRKPGAGFAAHERVNHSAKEYAREDVTTNTVEGFSRSLNVA